MKSELVSQQRMKVWTSKDTKTREPYSNSVNEKKTFASEDGWSASRLAIRYNFISIYRLRCNAIIKKVHIWEALLTPSWMSAEEAALQYVRRT